MDIKRFEPGLYRAPQLGTATISDIARHVRTAFCTVTHFGKSYRAEIRLLGKGECVLIPAPGDSIQMIRSIDRIRDQK